jgi:hypothetical protein
MSTFTLFTSKWLPIVIWPATWLPVFIVKDATIGELVDFTCNAVQSNFSLLHGDTPGFEHPVPNDQVLHWS